MRVMTRILNSFPLLYLLLLWPGHVTIWDLYGREWYYPEMMHISGVWSIRLLILCIAVTPVLRLINWIGHGKALGRWLLPRRRHFGLASGIYAFVHLAHYVMHAEDLADIWIEAFDLAFLTGWISLLIYAALTVTSNDWSVIRLGRWWKKLHLLVYPAAAFAFWHWYLFDFHIDRAGFWAALFCAPKLIQGGVHLWRRRLNPATAKSTFRT